MREYMTIEDLAREIERTPGEVEALIIQMGERVTERAGERYASCRVAGLVRANLDCRPVRRWPDSQRLGHTGSKLTGKPPSRG
jgi:hypothetical protein